MVVRRPITTPHDFFSRSHESHRTRDNRDKDLSFRGLPIPLRRQVIGLLNDSGARIAETADTALVSVAVFQAAQQAAAQGAKSKKGR